ncbi:MAG TPA: glycosyltransferase [Tepidisphaeraceae bacterium]|nr:glycosyltransferase [Tepidisphaeraceae bacterium]
MLELSIILPTCNRAALLERSLASIEAGVRCEHEIIVVDGASTDQTKDVLSDAQRKLGARLQVIREPKREGFVKAANKGFRAAQGKNMTWLNDDARPLPGSLDAAIEQLDSQPDNVAFVAMFHRWNSTKNVAYETDHRGRTYRLCHVRGTLYANFPMGRRETYERLDYFDERFYICGADPDLSLKAWYSGMSIVPAIGAIIDHDEVEDARRVEDSAQAKHDNDALFEKWELPPRNPYRNDFDPKNPCTLRILRDVLCHAA